MPQQLCVWMKKGHLQTSTRFVRAGLALTLWVTWHVLTRPGSEKGTPGRDCYGCRQTEDAAPETYPEAAQLRRAQKIAMPQI